LEGLTTVGKGDVWVAITHVDPNSGNDSATTWHRAAGVWHRVAFEQPTGAGNVDPRDIRAFGPSAIWMVGFYYNGPDEHALLERWNGSHWVRFTGVNPGSQTFLERVIGFDPHAVAAG